MKNSYFSHDSNARNDSKLIKLRMRYGAEGYGVYFMVLERLREEADYTSVKDYNMIAFDLRVDAALVKAVVEDFGLFAFTEDGECFYSESFNTRMSLKDEKSKARSEAGKRGGAPKGNCNASKNKQSDAEKQAKTSKCEEENKQKQAFGCFETSKESKVKERKENKEKVEKKTASVFRPPDLSEVSAYVQEKGYAVNAERFWNFYESKGWYVGKNKMKNWHAAVATWQKSEKENANPPTTERPTTDRDTARAERERQFLAYAEQRLQGGE